MSKEANCLKSAIYYAKKHKQTEKLAILLTKRETINEHKRSIRLHPAYGKALDDHWNQEHARYNVEKSDCKIRGTQHTWIPVIPPPRPIFPHVSEDPQNLETNVIADSCSERNKLQSESKRQKISRTTSAVGEKTHQDLAPIADETWEKVKRDPACSILKKLQTEINGRIAKTAILEEEHTVLSTKLAAIKDEIENNSIELSNRQEQLQEQKKRVAIIPTIFDEIVLTVFYPVSSIMR